MYTVEVIRFQYGAMRYIKHFNDIQQASTAVQNTLFSLRFERLAGRKRATIRILHDGIKVKEWRFAA